MDNGGAGSRRRARDERLAAYRDFCEDQGWQVIGLPQGLSDRYPVEPLLAAVSAQAELAVTGTWARTNAMVASVLVQAPAESVHRTSDVVVQLTTVDTGPRSLEFTATWHQTGPAIALLGKGPEDQVAALARELASAADQGLLLPGDHIAGLNLELLHTRSWDDGHHEAPPDFISPLRLLTGLAATLD